MAEQKTGAIQLILGPMFSGKTEEGQRRLRRYQLARKSVVQIKPSCDTRYSPTRVISHSRREIDTPTIVATHLASEDVSEYDAIFVDEGQFFDDLADTCNAWAKEGRIVIVAALNGTFRSKPFESVSTVIPVADDVKMLKAVCDVCYSDRAAFSRMHDAKHTDDSQPVVGGAELYRPVCRKCDT